MGYQRYVEEVPRGRRMITRKEHPSVSQAGGRAGRQALIALIAISE